MPSAVRRRHASGETCPRKNWRTKRRVTNLTPYHALLFSVVLLSVSVTNTVGPQAETINRLLKKKSGTRNRRNALASADDRTPATQTGNGTPAEGEPEEEENGEVAPVPIIEIVPTCYRWISTTRPATDAPPGEEKMLMSFSVPTSLLPTPLQDGDGDVKMEAQEQPPKPRAPAVCNVDGCSAIRKYRLVRDAERGACGMGHLHLLETQPRVVAT